MKDQLVRPEIQNGRGPPVFQEKARHGENVGRASKSGINCGTARYRNPDKSDFRNWRTYYDNACGNIDEAIKAVYEAWSYGLLEDKEATEIDIALRSQQARIAIKPRGLAQIGHHLLGRGKSKLALGWPRRRPCRSPDREKSRERARTLGGSSHMPPQVRAKYTECERAVLFIVAREVKHHGICDLSVGQIAAEAGVCVRTVQNAVAKAVREGHICREERPQRGRKNLTNILRIVSLEWLAWIKRGPVGCKVCIATGNTDSKKRGARELRPRVARILRVSG